jgi:hypothetical protein
MSLAQAQKAGSKVRIGKRPMTRVARALEKGESQGSMRVMVDAETEEILGAAILGPGGDEAVHVALAAMAAGTPYTRLWQTMAIHPTVSELIPTILRELFEPSLQGMAGTSETARNIHQDQALDEALEETFPFSAPIAVSISKDSGVPPALEVKPPPTRRPSRGAVLHVRKNRLNHANFSIFLC